MVVAEYYKLLGTIGFVLVINDNVWERLWILD